MFSMHETVKNKPDTSLSRILTVLTIQGLAKLNTDTLGSYCSCAVLASPLKAIFTFLLLIL